MGVSGALLWVGGGEWGQVEHYFWGVGWAWVGISGVGEGEWRWVHCLIMSFSITLSGHDYFKEWRLF